MVEIIKEEEGPVGWTFTAQVLDGEGKMRRHRVALAFADYNLWSRCGQDRPAAVATAVLRFLLNHVPPQELRPAFDAAMARRMFEGADEMIPTLI